MARTGQTRPMVPQDKLAQITQRFEFLEARLNAGTLAPPNWIDSADSRFTPLVVVIESSVRTITTSTSTMRAGPDFTPPLLPPPLKPLFDPKPLFEPKPLFAPIPLPPPKPLFDPEPPPELSEAPKPPDPEEAPPKPDDPPMPEEPPEDEPPALPRFGVP